MKIGIAADHGGFELKEQLMAYLKPLGYEIEDFGAHELDTSDDYPDFIVPLAQAVAAGRLSRGIAVCGSGVGASVAANKVAGARAALITEHFSAHQGVEDDDLNIICLGGRITGYVAAEELVLAFLRAEFSGADRHQRRLEKVRVLEKENLN
ncbi:RpiB/LacA/LacB family sugar-phosphate isomerase [Pedobacter nutrimenti]|uniref:RpiB/LacA/LacB family sugar-phosphate isomerase n=1 Tax=Pedobacter nutrimenti TaxID=1241337 RepID=UPI00292D65C4|nr:RpiB/LacA/LacB family sugar-phosphate isomerase [Pedobacter nutrimenti]